MLFFIYIITYFKDQLGGGHRIQGSTFGLYMAGPRSIPWPCTGPDLLRCMHAYKSGRRH